MVNRVKVLSTAFDSVLRRITKFKWMGNDVQTAREAGPYGFDSNPIRNMIAIYAPIDDGKSVIIGYINKNQLAQVGESRMYSTDADGDLKTYVLCKNNGVLELGGNAKHLARYEELKTGFDQLKADLNTLISQYNLHVHASNGVVTISTATSSTASIDSSKTDNVKTL